MEVKGYVYNVSNQLAASDYARVVAEDEAGGAVEVVPARTIVQTKPTSCDRIDKFEGYYNDLGLVPKEDQDGFWEAMRRDLPNSFRFTGSKAHALAVQQRLRDFTSPRSALLPLTDNTSRHRSLSPGTRTSWHGT